MEQPIISRPRRPSYADIEALPPNVVGEILAGELVVSPRPAGPHAVAASCIGGYLNHAFELGLSGPGGWWIVDEPELSLGVDPDFDPVVPDLAGWRLETHPERPMSAQMHATPDWVCEVQSPGTARHDRVRKIPFYARAGVGHVWLVDPLVETVEVLILQEGRWVMHGAFGGDDTVSLPPFEAITVALSHLWGRQPPATDS